MYRTMLMSVVVTLCYVGMVRAECGGDASSCDPATIIQYPTDNTAGNLTYSPPAGECVLTGQNTMSTCTGLQYATLYACTNGVWNPTIATCFAATECPEPIQPTNGYTTGDDYALFKTINYLCNDGYSRVGAGTAQCSGSGEWSQPPPTCLASCSRPNVNATVSIAPAEDQYSDGTVVQFTCEAATTTMIGTDASTCRNGQWEPTPPSCYLKCTIPGTTTATLGNVQAEGSVVDHQTSVEFQCNSGRHYNDLVLGSTSGVQLCDDGEFPSPFAYCRANCTDAGYTPPQFAIMVPTQSTYYDNTVVQFECESGVLSVPNVMGTCSDGTWTVPTFECIQPLNCNNPGTPDNGVAQGTNYAHGDEVSFTCNTNYTLVGVSSIRCDNGSWSGNVPTCSETPRPVTNSSVRLECGSDSIEIRIDRSILPDLAGDVLIFEGNSSCTGVIDGDDIVFTTMFDQCGTTKELDGDLDVYKNRIVNGAVSGAVVSRDITVSFPITCFYERVHRLEYGYSVMGSSGVVQQALMDTGSYSATFDFSMYTDETFTMKVDPDTNIVPVNQRAYFAVEATTSPNQFVIIESCWTTPTNDPEDDRRYNLITDQCTNEQTVDRYELGGGDRAAFSVSGFTYIDTDQIYLYCTVAICGMINNGVECTPCGVRRRRGAASAQLKDLSVGPVRWAKADSMDMDMAVDVPEDEDSVGHAARPWMTAVVVMATVMAAMVVIILVLVRRNRRQTARFD